jgi:hypothetical protein
VAAEHLHIKALQQKVVQVVQVSLSSKLINLLVHQQVAVAVTSLINQLNKVLNIFSNKEEF